jgi:hypothetical protein
MKVGRADTEGVPTCVSRNGDRCPRCPVLFKTNGKHTNTPPHLRERQTERETERKTKRDRETERERQREIESCGGKRKTRGEENYGCTHHRKCQLDENRRERKAGSRRVTRVAHATQMQTSGKLCEFTAHARRQFGSGRWCSSATGVRVRSDAISKTTEPLQCFQPLL